MNLNQDPKDEDDEIKSLMKNLDGENQKALSNKSESQNFFDETKQPLYINLNNSAMDPNVSINNENIPLIKIQNPALKLIKVDSGKYSGSTSMMDPLSSSKKHRVCKAYLNIYKRLNLYFRLAFFFIKKLC